MAECVVERGGSVTLGLTTPSTITAAKVSWSNGTTGSKTLTLEDVQTSGEYTASFILDNVEQTFTFRVFVKANTTVVETGNYLIQDANSGRLLTSHGKGVLVTFEEGDVTTPAEGQTWFIDLNSSNNRYALISMPEELSLNTAAKPGLTKMYSFYLDIADGSDRYALHIGTATNPKYWTMDENGAMSITNTQLTTFPFRLIPLDDNGIGSLSSEGAKANKAAAVYDLSGRRIGQHVWPKGIYIVDGKKIVIK